MLDCGICFTDMSKGTEGKEICYLGILHYRYSIKECSLKNWKIGDGISLYVYAAEGLWSIWRKQKRSRSGILTCDQGNQSSIIQLFYCLKCWQAILTQKEWAGRIRH